MVLIVQDIQSYGTSIMDQVSTNLRQSQSRALSIKKNLPILSSNSAVAIIATSQSSASISSQTLPATKFTVHTILPTIMTSLRSVLYVWGHEEL